MFDLNKELKKWRKLLASCEYYGEEYLAELESHLIDVFDELKESGLSEEKAFHSAVERIGKTKKITQEYKQVNRDLIWKQKTVVLSCVWVLYHISLLVLFSLNSDLYNRYFPTYSGDFPNDISYSFSFMQILHISIVTLTTLPGMGLTAAFLVIVLSFSRRHRKPVLSFFNPRWIENLSTKAVLFGIGIIVSLSIVPLLISNHQLGRMSGFFGFNGFRVDDSIEVLWVLFFLMLSGQYIYLVLKEKSASKASDTPKTAQAG